MDIVLPGESGPSPLVVIGDSSTISALLLVGRNDPERIVVPDRNRVVPITPEEKHLWEILVPKKDNHGVRFTKEHHQYVYASLRNVSGGLTRFPAVCGESEYEHQPYVEMMIPVRFTATVFDAKKSSGSLGNTIARSRSC